MASWEWSESAKRYRDSKGRFLSLSAVREIRDRFVDDRAGRMADLADQLNAEAIDLPTWTARMREAIKGATLAEYALGRGGMRAMTKSDFGTVGNLVKAQYRYLQAFAREIAAGNLSGPRIRARAQLYGRAATAAYGRGTTAAYGLKLSQLPGDGQTECLTNCRCHLEISETEEEWSVRWVVHRDDESCEDCLGMAEKWSPLTISKPKEG